MYNSLLIITFAVESDVGVPPRVQSHYVVQKSNCSDHSHFNIYHLVEALSKSGRRLTKS